MNSRLEANNIYHNRRLLSGTNIFVDKDYPVEARNKRFILRQIGNEVKKANSLLKVGIGDSRIFIDNKPFSYMDNKIVANTNNDADFLKKILLYTSYEIVVKEPRHKNAANINNNAGQYN
ncbi:uncharacterized protein LOC142221496 [Haematobia irritans]|uniref:uncharacterized protein LOC142221496 n=1 Tax=Haematobia irritans TaxID=7368 RepID=UPI003F4F6288